MITSPPANTHTHKRTKRLVPLEAQREEKKTSKYSSIRDHLLIYRSYSEAKAKGETRGCDVERKKTGKMAMAQLSSGETNTTMITEAHIQKENGRVARARIFLVFFISFVLDFHPIPNFLIYISFISSTYFISTYIAPQLHPILSLHPSPFYL
jgi:hypothetical protein